MNFILLYCSFPVIFCKKWNDWCFRPRFCTVRLYCRRQPEQMRSILLWIMPLLHDRSIDLLASSPACYLCSTDASYSVRFPPKLITHLLTHALTHPLMRVVHWAVQWFVVSDCSVHTMLYPHYYGSMHRKETMIVWRLIDTQWSKLLRVI